MPAATILDDAWVELADRSGDGLDIRLLWHRPSGDVKVTVTRLTSGHRGELRVRPEDALAAFHHPFAYRELTRARERPEPVGAID